MKIKFFISGIILFLLLINQTKAQDITFSGPTGVTSIASGTILSLTAVGQTTNKYIGSVPTFGYSNYYDNSINGDVTCDLWETNYTTGVFKYKFVNNGSIAKKIKFLFVDVRIITVSSNGTYSGYLTNIEFEITVQPAPVAPVFYNVAQSFVFYKSNCNPTSEDGSAVTYSVPAGTYTSTVSQAHANQTAQNAIFLYGQAYANTNGTCTINPNKIITYTDFPQVSDTFDVLVNWNSNKISSQSVTFEVYQFGILKHTISNISNNGSTLLQFLGYLQPDGHTYRNVRLKIISDSNPNQYEFTPGADWFID